MIDKLNSWILKHGHKAIAGNTSSLLHGLDETQERRGSFHKIDTKTYLFHIWEPRELLNWMQMHDWSPHAMTHYWYSGSVICEGGCGNRTGPRWWDQQQEVVCKYSLSLNWQNTHTGGMSKTVLFWSVCALVLADACYRGCLEWGKWTDFKDNIFKTLVEYCGVQVNFHTGKKPTTNQSASHSMNRSQ
jgi:hypothetical protein